MTLEVYPSQLVLTRVRVPRKLSHIILHTAHELDVFLYCESLSGKHEKLKTMVLL
jgi:hypothetical protein